MCSLRRGRRRSAGSSIRRDTFLAGLRCGWSPGSGVRCCRRGRPGRSISGPSGWRSGSPNGNGAGIRILRLRSPPGNKPPAARLSGSSRCGCRRPPRKLRRRCRPDRPCRRCSRPTRSWSADRRKPCRTGPLRPLHRRTVRRGIPSVRPAVRLLFPDSAR